MRINYTKKMIGEELKKELDYGGDLQRISDWALKTSLENSNPDPALQDVLSRLCLMEMGYQFEYTKEELYQIAQNLMNNKLP